MTATTCCSSQNAPAEVLHPLDPLTASEITRFRQLVIGSGLAHDETRFSYVMLREPDTAIVAAFRAGQAVPREISALLLDKAANIATYVCFDIIAGTCVENRQLDPATDGWGPVLDEDFVAAEEICKADPDYLAALVRRGITDLTDVRCFPLSAGNYGYEDENGLRLLRVLSFLALGEGKHGLMAHPIEGVVVYADLSNHRAHKVIDTGFPHIPQESGDYLDPAVTGPMRTTLKPLEITQPEGVSFTLTDNVLTWENWSIRVGFNGREGLTLHDIHFNDRGRNRKIMHRASVSEMVVPYGEPTPTHEWQNYFDAGEYQFGRLANSLKLGCDCLGAIRYVDAVVADDFGRPFGIPSAICIHEEDYGTLWKHRDVYTNQSDVRRQRRLVVSFFVTVGNYDYGFYWHFYLDGKIQLECKATGIVFTSGLPSSDWEFATEMAPGLGAPIHQHMFSARLHMALDGAPNHVDEIEAARVPMGPHNPRGNAFTRTITRLTDEQDAQRIARNDLARVWRVGATGVENRLGANPGYVLFPEGQPLLLAADEASIRARANFASKSLWVTQFDRDQLWAAGYSPNQHPGGAGLPEYVAGNRPIDGQDIVLWHTFGLTHFPRTEDWPIMPTDYAGFVMKPDGFFDRNPTLDVPEVVSKRSVNADADGSTCCKAD